MSKDFKIVIDCPICDEHELQVVNDETKELMQCISCGYSTSSDMEGTIETCESYKKIDSSLRKWAKEAKGHVWLPSVLNLELGIFYPSDKDDEMIWAFAPLVNIPEEEQKNYPIPDKEGKFYKQKYDIENQEIFEQFLFAMAKMNALSKSESNG